jgi:hypothetical protein
VNYWAESSLTKQSVTAHYYSTNNTYNPQFSCPGGTNSQSTQHPLQSISFPDGSALSTSWETKNSKITGRLASFSVPIGGKYTFSYSGGTYGDGIWCNGSNAALQGISNATIQITTNEAPVGQWTLARTWISYTFGTSQTVVTRPDNSKSTITFSNNYPTTEVDTDTDGSTPLRTIYTCYFGNTFPCPVQQDKPQFLSGLQINTYVVIPGVTRSDTGGTCALSGCPSETATTYDQSGNTTEVDSFGYGPVLLSKKIYAYGSWNGSKCDTSALSANSINNRICDVTITDGGSTVASHTRYTYTANGELQYKYEYSSATAYVRTSYQYNANGTVASVTKPDGISKSFGTANCNGYAASSMTLGNGTSNVGTENYQFDCNGGLRTQYQNMNSLALTYAYDDPLFKLTQVGDNQGTPPTTIQNTPNLILSSMSDSANGYAITQYTILDDYGRLLAKTQVDGSNYDTVSYQYDSSGRRYQVSKPCTTSAYTGGPCSPFVAAHTYTYDGLNRLKTDTIYADAGTATQTYTYNGPDKLSVLSPAPSGENNKQIQTEYDGLNRVVSICVGTSALPGSGLCGQRAAVTGYLTTFTHDGAGRVLQTVKNAQGSTKQTFSTVYDLLGRTMSSSNPMSGTTTYFYDTATGVCSGQTSPSAGKLTERDDANGNKVCYAYDAVGGRFASSLALQGPNAGTSTKNLYYDGGPTCNLNGRVATTAAGGGLGGTGYDPAINFCYDPYGRTTSVTMVYNGINDPSNNQYVTTASYFANGGLKSLDVVNGLGHATGSHKAQVDTITYTLDPKGRPYTAVDSTTGQKLVNSVTYDNQDRPLVITYGNGTGGANGDVDTYTYDSVYGVNSWSFNINGQTDTGTLTLNPNGTLAKLVVANQLYPADDQTCTLTHDDLGQVTSQNCGSPFNTTYSYDEFANVTATGTSAFSPGYNKANNQEQDGATYDSNGWMLHDPTLSANYTWDSFGNIIYSDASTLAYSYDAYGRIVHKETPTCSPWPNCQPTGGGPGNSNDYVMGPTGLQGQAAASSQKALAVSGSLPGGSYISFNGASLRLGHVDQAGSTRLLTNFLARTGQAHNSWGPFGERYGSAASTEVDWSNAMQYLQLDTFGQHIPARKRSVSPPYIGNNSPF